MRLLVVVGPNRVQHDLRLAVPLAEPIADLHMAQLLLVGEPLADIVQQPRTTGHLHIHSHLGGHVASQQSHLAGVRQLVLSVGGPELEVSEHLQNLRVETVYPKLVEHLLRRLPHLLVHLLDASSHRLLDAARVDPAVLD